MKGSTKYENIVIYNSRALQNGANITHKEFYLKPEDFYHFNFNKITLKDLASTSSASDKIKKTCNRLVVNLSIYAQLSVKDFYKDYKHPQVNKHQTKGFRDITHVVFRCCKYINDDFSILYN